MTDRPYRPYLTVEILERAEVAYKNGDVGSLEDAIEEMTVHRSHGPDSEAVIAVRHMIADLRQRAQSRWTLDLQGPRPTDEWLDKVAAIAARFKAEDTGVATVYLALLWDVNDDEEHGVYVGMTGLSAEDRYHNHRIGYKAGRKWVTRYGIGLLTPMFAHLRGVSHADAERIEKDLAGALQAEGLLVRGGH